MAIYLQDHLAGATAGLELAKRAHGANRETEFEAALAALRDEIDADRATLIAVMSLLSVGRDRPKETGAWLAEKAGRLKLNGQLRGYSPLSRVVELEGLMLGATGKLRLWETLAGLPEIDGRLAGVDLDALRARAESQRTRIAELLARATALAFA